MRSPLFPDDRFESRTRYAATLTPLFFPVADAKQPGATTEKKGELGKKSRKNNRGQKIVPITGSQEPVAGGEDAAARVAHGSQK